MIINTHKLCKKGTLHWCFMYHFCPDDRVAAYHEKCGLEFKIPFNHFEPVKHLNAVLSPHLAHLLWHTLCTVALTNRGARQRVFPLDYLSFSNACTVMSQCKWARKGLWELMTVVQQTSCDPASEKSACQGGTCALVVYKWCNGVQLWCCYHDWGQWKCDFADHLLSARRHKSVF